MSRKKRNKGTRPSAAANPASPGEAVESPADADPIKWRWKTMLSGLLLLSVLILFLSWIKFFDLLGVDRYLQDLLISYVGSTVSNDFDSRVKLLLIDKESQPNQPFGNPDPKHRPYHTDLIRFLQKAGAKVIVFDVEFRTSSDNDQGFAQAIQEAERAGTKIVVGGFLEKPKFEPLIAASLKQAIGDHWGIVDGQIPESKSEARFIRLAAPRNNEPPTLMAEQPVIPSLALQAVRLLHYPNEGVNAWYNVLAGEVRLRSDSGKLLQAIPVNSQIGLLVDLPGKNEIPRESYQNVLAHPNDFTGSFLDKIVVVGYQVGDELPFLDSDKQSRYGSEYHAAAISTILAGSYLRQLPILYHYFAILLLVVIAAFLQIRFSSWMARTQTVPLPFLPAPINKITIPTPILVISLAYILVVVIAFKVGHIVFDMSYHLAALILTYFLFLICRPLFTRKVIERKT